MSFLKSRTDSLFQVTETEVECYKSVLETEIGSSLKVNLSKFELRQIHAPAFVCKASGLLRIERPDKVPLGVTFKLGGR